MSTIYLSPGLYLVAWLGYVLHFSRRERWAGFLATGCLIAGAGVHMVALGTGGWGPFRCPVETAGGFLSIYALLVVLTYVSIERAFDERTLGLFIAPMAVVLYGAAIVGSPVAAASGGPALMESGWFGAHILSMLAAYAAFTLAGAMALMYIVLQRKLTRVDMGLVFSYFPDLATLDRMTFRCVMVGFPSLTVGLVTGAFWAAGTLESGWWADPKMLVSSLLWLAYAIFLAGRWTRGWQGLRFAWMAVGALALVLFSQLWVSAHLTQVHRF